ncbi:RcnB family protein [Sphingomonas sp. 28-63-12]|uniref:RcnB family protein n=1 Tax=Sphingomonas sp. 28-63-12 TaxID=1970434 RepID=UPI000BD66AFC|nr:MAG: hypothetical protein B7Y47_07850 [Sphingomonas sp. 28-63-12]
MKKTILSTIALSMIATPVLAADRRDDRRDTDQRTVIVQKQPSQRTVIVQKQTYQAPRYQAPRYQAQQNRNWRRGERFDYRQARNYRVINDYRARHLKAPPRGYRYVQSGNDAVLVGITTGLIAAIITGAIH